MNLYTVDEREFAPGFREVFDAGRDAYLAGDWQGGFEQFNAAQQILADAGQDEDPVTASLLARIDSNRTFWFKAVDHIRARAPEVVTDHVEAALAAKREQIPHQAPVTWRGYWRHTK